ncbi:MAG: hypothetical protein HQL41_17160, partial [Alphaproteobacteria bacterium]|nr:hypothetical protein [Alphaproteobacteria bacterium]
MVADTRRKDRPLSMRLPESDLALIDRAAGLRGENGPLRMSPEGFDAFMTAMSAPAEPVPA